MARWNMTDSEGVENGSTNSEPIPITTGRKVSQRLGRALRKPDEGGDNDKRSGRKFQALPGTDQTYPSLAPINSDPALITPAFDLVHELITDIEKYRGDECLTLMRVPGYVRSTIDRFQYNFPSSSYGHKPGIAPVTAACIVNGLQTFRSHPSVSALAKIQECLIDASEINRDTNAVLYDAVSKMVKSFSLDVFPSGLSGYGSINITLPTGIKNALYGFAASISLNQSIVAVLCIAESLRAEDSTIEGHAKQLDESIETFLMMVDWRAKSLRTMLEMLKEQGLAHNKTRKRGMR